MLLLACAVPAFGGTGLYVEFFKDTPTQWGAFGSDPNFPKPYYAGVDPNIDFIFGNNENQYFSARWRGYLYVPSSKAGDIEFTTVTDDGARLYLNDQLVLDFWRLQAHQTIGTPDDECTHSTVVNLSEGYHKFKFEYFEWEGGEGDADPCQVLWDDVVIPAGNFFTEDPSGLAITDVSHSPSPFNPTQSETCTIYYTISADADVTITLTDLEGNRVRLLLDAASRSQGANSEVWDGKDDAGAVVPDDVYLYTIEAETAGGDYAVYSPGGGTTPEVTNFEGTSPFNPSQGEECTISYNLSADALCRIRIGVQDGPLLRTLVDWEPRFSGANSDIWDGRDDSGSIVPADMYLIAIWADAMPVNGIITEGQGP
ncbi:MAG: PA14 domain-containing protein [Armatimonadota bacterium]